MDRLVGIIEPGANLFIWLGVLFLIFVLKATAKRPGLRFWGLCLMGAVWFLGTRPAADLALATLEKRYERPDVADLKRQGIRQVVVLSGGGYDIPAGGPLASAFPAPTAARFLGGLELSRRLGRDCKLIFSGSAGRGNRQRPTADMMEACARLLVPDGAFASESRSGRTAEHPLNLKALVGEDPFILVTSASHLPRSMRLFHRAGLAPIPYPVDDQARGGPYRLRDWLPAADGYQRLQAALREYCALVLYFLGV